MKGFWLVLAVVLVCCAPQQTKQTGGAVFDISPEIVAGRVDTLVDIGRVREGETVLYTAAIRNTGTTPLVIKEISTSCGCTSVEYEKQPIAPTAESPLSLRLDTRGMWGMQHKLVEIHTSAGDTPFRITLRAEVEQTDN
jgi:LEA14-like dessication related protein